MTGDRTAVQRRWLVLASHVPPTGHLGGMIRYTVETARALHARADVDLHVHCHRETVPFFVSTIGLRVENVHGTAAGSTMGRSLEETMGLRATIGHVAPDVVFGSKHLLPTRDIDALRMLTIHDMLPLDRPGDFGIVKRTVLPRQYRRSIAAADVLACVSRAARDRLVHHLPDTAGRAVVVRNAMTTGLCAVEPEPLPAIAGRRFALVVGDFSLRKNVGHVVRLWSTVRASQPDAVLALVGPSGWGHNQEIPELETLVAEGAAVLLGHVSDAELRWAYEHATVLLCPSLLEGFGLPVIEAAAFGCPTIVSTDPALVEAAEGRGVVVGIDDPKVWVEQILAAFTTPAMRRSVPVDALRSWDDTAVELVAAAGAHRPMAAT